MLGDLDSEVKSLQKEFIELRGVTPTPLQLISFLEKKRGSLVIRPTAFTYEDDSYLIPTSSDDSVDFLDTKTVPGCFRLTTMRVNPKFFPSLATLQAFELGIKDKKSKKSTTIKKMEVKEEEPDFVEDTIGDETLIGEEPAPQPLETHVDNVVMQCESFVDAKKAIIAQCLGKSILNADDVETRHVIQVDPSKRSAFPFASYTQLQTKAVGSSNRDEPRDIPLIQEVASTNPLETPVTIDDAKTKKKSERERRMNEKDDWFGMKRVKITPDVRTELKAIDLRGFVDPKQRYRGSKRRFDLAYAESGFFQMGVMVNGGLENQPVNAESKLYRDGKTKRTKTLVKTLLQPRITGTGIG